MAKLTIEQKIEIFNKKENGQTDKSLCLEYNIGRHNVQYLCKLIKRHGPEILKKTKNRVYSSELKVEIINKVLIDHQSIYSTAIEYGLPSVGMLVNWIKSYKENEYVIIEKKRGRKSIMKQENKTIYPNDKDEEILRLKAEVEYLKKLHAVVQTRKNQQSKKK